MTPDRKVCPSHPGGPELLPIESFGICRSRSDGRNLYCRECIHRKVKEQRHRVKEMKAARSQYETPHTDLPPLPARKPFAISRAKEIAKDLNVSFMASMVLLAYEQGAHSYSQIVRVVKSHLTRRKAPLDEIELALVELIIDRRIFKAQGCGDDRLYIRRNVA